MTIKNKTAGTELVPSFRDPFAFLRQMTSDLDRVFVEPWGAFRPRWDWAAEPRGWTPSMELFEKDNRLVARFEVPGLRKEDVRIEVADGFLTVSGERKHESEEKKENFYRCEREYGSFYRSIPLPDGVTGGDVKASMTDGVLEVTVPLPAKAIAPAPYKVEVTEPAVRTNKAA